jgi:hypothetical protein
MTQEEIINGNIAIHLFNGYDEIPKGHYHQMNPDLRYFGHMDRFGTVVELLSENDLEYHISWDWLMPVVEKIESIHDEFHGYFGVHISSNSCTIQGTKLRTDPENFHAAYFDNVTHDTKIAATHLAVIQFIQFYNTQTQQHGTTI